MVSRDVAALFILYSSVLCGKIENTAQVRELCSNLRAPENLSFGQQQMINARFSLWRIEPVPLANSPLLVGLVSLRRFRRFHSPSNRPDRADRWSAPIVGVSLSVLKPERAVRNPVAD
jgi:hypothetical protein